VTVVLWHETSIEIKRSSIGINGASTKEGHGGRQRKTISNLCQRNSQSSGGDGDGVSMTSSKISEKKASGEAGASAKEERASSGGRIQWQCEGAKGGAARRCADVKGKRRNSAISENKRGSRRRAAYHSANVNQLVKRAIRQPLRRLVS